MRGEPGKFGAIDDLPEGKYALALSGGADSTALLVLLRERRPDLVLHVVHLNHQTRGEESDGEERFVRRLAERYGLACRIARRSEIEPTLQTRPRNRSALFREMRRRLLADTVAQHSLAGVLLAHHADDQAETVLQRLLRGSGILGLRGMSSRSLQHIGEQRLILFRPLLGVRREELRSFLRDRAQAWCEDSSNQSDRYLRNCLRRILEKDRNLSDAIIELGEACERMNDWVAAHAPDLEKKFRVEQMWDLPERLAEAAAKKYLVKYGCPAADLTVGVLRRFVEMANDAAAPRRGAFPGNVKVRRRGRVIAVENPR